MVDQFFDRSYIQEDRLLSFAPIGIDHRKRCSQGAALNERDINSGTQRP